MKPIGNTQRRSLHNSWQHQPQIKNAVLHRIRSITGELEAIQSEMHSALTQRTNENKVAQLFEDGAAVQVLNDFKAELDQMRRILWFYFEEASEKPLAGVDQEQQAERLQRVNELLRALSPKPAKPVTVECKPSGSFFERLDVVIDTYLQEKKPVAPVEILKRSDH
jgi:DNA-binding FrmR family transcriptional regulator